MKEKALVEAALFVSQEPLTIKAIGKILGTRSKKKITQIMRELKEDFEKNNRGLQLVFTGQGYELRIRNEFVEKVAPFAPYTDLSKGMTRSLALIAANSPIKQSELVKMQGNKVYDYVKKLEKKGLIKSKKFGRTKLLSPTKNFEIYFGKSLEEIREKLREVVTEAQARAIAPEEAE
jgi:segregation and condensation protein B